MSEKTIRKVQAADSPPPVQAFPGPVGGLIATVAILMGRWKLNVFRILPRPPWRDHRKPGRAGNRLGQRLASGRGLNQGPIKTTPFTSMS